MEGKANAPPRNEDSELNEQLPMTANRLTDIERQFWKLIQSRAPQKLPEEGLPNLFVFFDEDNSCIDKSRNNAGNWFPVPGMYGGFAYSFTIDKGATALVTDSWCRVAGGSGQRHLVTPEGAKLIEEGFV